MQTDALTIHNRDGSKTRISQPFRMQREVAFFLRIHGHLPDANCGDSWPFGKCRYSVGGEPINAANDYVDKLRENPAYVEKEKAVQQAQAEWQNTKKGEQQCK